MGEFAALVDRQTERPLLTSVNMEYAAADYYFPSVKGENVESVTFGVPRKKWQRRLSWLVPAWRKYRTFDVKLGEQVGPLRFDKLADPERYRVTYEGPGGSFFVVDYD